MDLICFYYEGRSYHNNITLDHLTHISILFFLFFSPILLFSILEEGYVYLLSSLYIIFIFICIFFNIRLTILFQLGIYSASFFLCLETFINF